MADFSDGATGFDGTAGVAVDGAFELAADGDAEFGEGARFWIEWAGLGGGVAEGFIRGKSLGIIFGELNVTSGKFLWAGRAGTLHRGKVAQALRDCKQALLCGGKDMKLWKSWMGAALFLLAMGCASEDKEFDQSVARLRPVEPPTYFNGEIASLFGTANFTARLEVQRGMQAPMAGELYGRDGSLFFMADEQRDKRGMSGGLSVLWHAPTKTAYLLNDPLQAYAPIRIPNTNNVTEAKGVGEEIINGERCRKSIITQDAAGETIPRWMVWRSIDKQDLPIRIQSTNSPSNVTLTVSRIRMQAPPAELLALPNGFKAYDSTDAMMAELNRRRTDAMDARSRARREKFGNNPNMDEDSSFNAAKPVRPY